MNHHDALTIARWCWPQDGAYLLFDETRWTVGESVRGVTDAERVLIERGHEEAYGFALCWALFCERDEAFESDVTSWDLYSGEDFTKLATAPLDARVRAMAAVIRGLA